MSGKGSMSIAKTQLKKYRRQASKNTNNFSINFSRIVGKKL
jgi:hypothetical protein